MNRHGLTLLVGAAGMALIGAVLVLRRSSSQPPAESEAPLAARRSGVPASPPSPDGVVDLLDLIDGKRDGIVGSWGFQGRALVMPALPWARLRVPCLAPEEYDLEARVERVAGDNSLNIGLSSEGRPFMVVIDGWQGGQHSGLDMIDQKPFFENASTRRGSLLSRGRVRLVTCSIRKSGVTVRVDGHGIIDWKRKFEVLSAPSDWSVDEPKAFFLGSWESRFRVHELKLTPLKGSPVLLHR